VFFAANQSGVIWQSNDGDAWTAMPAGFPNSGLGRIALAVQPTNPDVVYALSPTPWANLPQPALKLGKGSAPTAKWNRPAPRRVHSEADVLADRVLARPKTSCRGFVDHHHFGRILPVGIRERAATHQRNLHGLEVGRRRRVHSYSGFTTPGLGTTTKVKGSAYTSASLVPRATPGVMSDRTGANDEPIL
jgi:hypothetical protein